MDPQFERSIGQQHAISRPDVSCQLGIAAGCPFARSGDLLGREHEACS
jgi:hypothetical protein